ncbi:MAG TPA: hypothetical protein VF469_14210 [Kofleriaceae bacterium]
MCDPKFVMSLYVDRFENSGRPLVMVVANDASVGGNATPYVVNGVDPASKNSQFAVWLGRDQLDLLIKAVTYEHRMVRVDKVTGGVAEVRLDHASGRSDEAHPGELGGELGPVRTEAGELLADNVNPGTVVITDPGGGNNGPKTIVLVALAVNLPSLAAA